MARIQWTRQYRFRQLNTLLHEIVVDGNDVVESDCGMGTLCNEYLDRGEGIVGS